MRPATTEPHPAKGASIIAMFAGLWLFISPWIYGTYGNANSWNSWLVGALIFLLSLIRAERPARTPLSWTNSVLAIWIFVSPWALGYTGRPGRMINSLIIGIIVFCAAIAGANSQRMSHDMTSTV